ncbi:hypothetical protein M404DRAFT_991843 [Pisolithus tinctorius Marx 270]|uniref:Uncharacterized protein n=1 Tax=Pisolithus tinctorius Marx 270 TaxID=870435 RepID=A0A0C3K145_PISTI|nr:hypothetical protein M404DRAFT_991843 [Pisolithus tinctorius Marx 270]
MAGDDGKPHCTIIVCNNIGPCGHELRPVRSRVQPFLSFWASSSAAAQEHSASQLTGACWSSLFRFALTWFDI